MLWKKTIIMLVAFGVLTLAAFMVSAVDSTGSGPLMELTKVGSDAVTKIEITNLDVPVTLEKSGDAWKITDGNYKVAEKKMETALNIIADPRIGNLVSKSAANHEKFGVTDKALTLAVYTQSGEVMRLLIGNETVDKAGNYVRKAQDKKIFASAARLKSTFDKKAKDWRERTILKYDKEQAIGLALTAGTETISFAKSEDGKWAFDPVPAGLPAGYTLDSEKVDRITRSMANFTATDFVDNPTTFGDIKINPPESMAIVELKTGETYSIMIGAEKDKKFVAVKQGDDQIYLVSDYQAKKINQGLDELRDLHVTSFEPDEAVKIEITQGDSKIVLSKGKEWGITESSVQPAADFRFDPQSAQNLVRTVSRLEAKSVAANATSASTGMGAPSGTISVSLDSGALKLITLGAKTGDKEIFVMGDEGKIFIAAEATATRLLKKVDDFKVRAKQQTPQLSPEAMKNLPPGVAEQLMQKQRQQIMQNQMLRQMMKQKQAPEGKKTKKK